MNLPCGPFPCLLIIRECISTIITQTDFSVILGAVVKFEFEKLQQKQKITAMKAI